MNDHALLTDLRQGVTPAQHAALDQLDARAPLWRMMTIAELHDLIKRDVLAGSIDAIRMAALCLHIADRNLAKATAADGSITDPGKLGIFSFFLDGDEHGFASWDLDTAREALEILTGDQIHPVLEFETFIKTDPLFATLIPLTFDDGHPKTDELRFYPTEAAARTAREAAFAAAVL